MKEKELILKEYHGVIRKVAKKMNLPLWWVEAIAIEYTECREYATCDDIWTFNFDKLLEKDLEEAVRSHHVAVYAVLIHNIVPGVYGTRFIRSLHTRIPPLVEERNDIMPEGLVSEYHFPFLTNSIDVWDPKLGFSRCFQFRDNYKIWQWKIAEFITVKGRHYGKWVSSEIDLGPLNEMQERLKDLRTNRIKPGESSHSEFKKRVVQFYQELDKIRKPILSTLKDIHIKKRSSIKEYPKVVAGIPPKLSHYEKFTVIENEIHTKLIAAPIFFRGCNQHSTKAKDIYNSAKDDSGLIRKLDEIYQERTSAIIVGQACLEAFINDKGFEHFPKLWELIEEKLSLINKWKLYLILMGKSDIYDFGREPYQSLKLLIKKRNDLIHFKPKYEKVIRKGNKATTNLEKILEKEFVDNLPNRIKQLIKELCKATNLNVPTWITE